MSNNEILRQFQEMLQEMLRNGAQPQPPVQPAPPAPPAPIADPPAPLADPQAAPIANPARPPHPVRRRRNAQRGQGEQSHFTRNVIVLPSPQSSQVPRGRLRDSLRSQNLDRRVRFRVGMSHDDLRSEILMTFQAFGHLEDRLVFLIFVLVSF